MSPAFSQPRAETNHVPSNHRGPQEPAKQRVLVVDDEEDLLELVRYNLIKEGYAVECVGSGEQALQSARHSPPDLVVLDLMLPAVDGLEVCRRLKADPKTRGVLIVMLTAKGDEGDIITGLDRGADDYIAKPFSPRVLNARIKALLRREESRRREELETTIDVRALSIHPGRHEATLADLHRVCPAPVPGEAARLGLHPDADRRRGQGGGLSRHRAVGRRAGRRPAAKTGGARPLRRDRPGRWLPFSGLMRLPDAAPAIAAPAGVPDYLGLARHPFPATT